MHSTGGPAGRFVPEELLCAEGWEDGEGWALAEGWMSAEKGW